MSYIIAHVTFDSTGRTYPVNCLRTDLQIGDKVVVNMSKSPLKWAKIIDINFLNWNCQNTIECLASEANFTKDGIILPPGESRSVMGLTRLYDLKVSLYSIGWTPRRTASKMYRMAYSATNQNQTSLILMRKNGIDVQIIESLPTKTIRPNSILSISQSNGPFIRQPFYGSRDNILERTLKFAKAFLKNLENLETMVEPLQTTKTLPKSLQTTKTLSRPFSSSQYGEDLYSDLGGDGEPIYLSDGIWLTSDNNTHDRGRP